MNFLSHEEYYYFLLILKFWVIYTFAKLQGLHLVFFIYDEVG